MIFDSADELIERPGNVLLGWIVVPDGPADYRDYDEGDDRNTGLHVVLSIWGKLECESFEIFGFREGCYDGVIKALRMIVNHSEGSLAINCGTPDTLKKKFAGRVMRATEGRKDSTLIQHAEGPQVDFFVTTHRIFNGLLVPGERWGIKDY